MTKDNLPKTLRPYWDHEFSSGPYTGADYQKFQRAYVSYIRREMHGYSVKHYPNHYECTMVITRDGKNGELPKYVYLSISDVRFFPRQWATSILVRTMAHAKDWTGGPNNYCNLVGVRTAVEQLMEEAA